MAAWVRPARRSNRMRRFCPMVARSTTAATASRGNSSQKKTVRVIFQGRRGCDRKKPRLWGILPPRGRGQPAKPKNRVNFSIVTTCGVVRRFLPLRIVWHVAGRPGYGFEPRQRSRHCAPYIRTGQPPKNPANRQGGRYAQDSENDSHSHPLIRC